MQHEVILVTGTSGTGKTTVMRELANRGVETIGIDEEPHLTCWVNKETREPVVGDGVEFDQRFLGEHEWVCDISLLKELLAKHERPMVVCGSCDNIRECMEVCELTLLLSCPPEVFLRRIDERQDNSFGKTDAARQALLGYYEQYRDECVAAGAILVDADRAVDEVVNEVMTYIE